MSLFGALSSGVSGLGAHSSALGAISDNVANVNTVGYKSTEVKFQTLVTAQVSTTQYSPGGVQSAPDTQVDRQGLLQASTSSTDAAISGQGFFVVNQQPTASEGSLFAYTRAGSFSVDKDGFLQNTAGWYLQGWPLQIAGHDTTGFATVKVGDDTFVKAYQDTDGKTVSINENIVSPGDLQPLNLNTIGGTAAETKNIRLGANLPSGARIGESHKSNVIVYDTLGNKANLELVWKKNLENAWGLSTKTPSGAATLELHGTDSTDSAPDVFASSGLLEFTKVPADGETIVITDGTGVPITFEFDKDGSVTETSTRRRVDISSATIVAASNVVPLLKAAIDNSNLQGTGRFQDRGANLEITQSIMGSAIGIDVSGSLSVAQNAANRTPAGNGRFTVSEIDFAFKNGARIDFEPPHIQPGVALDLTFSHGNRITASAGTPFQNWQVGDTITVNAGARPSDADTRGNNGTYTITAVTGNTITVAGGSFPNGTTETEGSSLTVYNNSAPTEVYDNLDTVLTPATTGQRTTFRLHQPAQATAAEPFGIKNSVNSLIVGDEVSFTVANGAGGGPDTITAAAGTFSGYTVGESITVESTGGTASDADGTHVITGVSADGSRLEFDGGTWGGGAAGVLNNGADTLTLNTHTIRAGGAAGIPFTFVDGGAGPDQITAAPGTFNNYEVGDAFRINGTAASEGTYTVLAVAADGASISIATGSLTAGANNGLDDTLTLVRDRITATDTNAFANFRDGDVIAITNSENTANNVRLSVVGTNRNTYIEFASEATTTLSADNLHDEDMKVTITADSTGSIDYVDISSATTVSDIVTLLTADINANARITTPTRFTSDGTSLIFEQSPIGDNINIVMDSTTANSADGLITGVWQDSSTSAANTASDGETMAMIETSYGAKQAAVSFNGKGTPSQFNVDNIDIQWANGAADQEFTATADDTRIGLFLGDANVNTGMTQYAGSYQINFISQNGAQFGNFAGVSIGKDGVVTALFDNGVTRPVFQIPVTTFVNPNSMTPLSGNVFIETSLSGQPTVREAGEGGAGDVTGASLEASTVDLGEEFTAMIVTQRAYSASAKIITTADEMLDELLRISR